MEDLILRRIGELITRHSGICIREQDYRLTAEKLGRRTKALGLGSLVEYHDRLLRELETGLASQGGEWQALYAVLTINESYFFRDSNQFRLLSDRLLPDLLRRRQVAAEASGGRPRLRLWSAGCSTGEELYSLAIALTELGFAWDRWDALLIGTDISPTAIDSARKGLYGNWSFRQMPAELQRKYFTPHHQLYKICDSIQRRVVFNHGNLLTDGPLDGDIDLILCRNVFIYLDSAAIGQIVGRFHRVLRPQGYLLTGHTELYSQDVSQFQTLSFPESVVYCKPAIAPAIPVAPIGSPAPAKTNPLGRSAAVRRPLTTDRGPLGRSPRSSARVRSPQPPAAPREKALQEAEALLEQKAYASAIQRAVALYSAYPQCDDARKIAAHAYANSGLYDQAKQLCYEVLSRQPLSVDMYYLLAQIAEDQNDLNATKEHLRKIIYLDASHVRAHLDLASVYEREKQPEKSQKMRNQALILLGNLPPDARLDATSTTTVAEWKAHLEKQLIATED
jgi:chemotaxis protein methyltransferase CheR